jgi:hypothetical protein
MNQIIAVLARGKKPFRNDSLSWAMTGAAVLPTR